MERRGGEGRKGGKEGEGKGRGFGRTNKNTAATALQNAVYTKSSSSNSTREIVKIIGQIFCSNVIHEARPCS